MKLNALSLFKKIVCGLVLGWLSISAASADTLSDPVALLKEVTQGVLEALHGPNAPAKNDLKKAYEIVDARIIPRADFVEMAQWVSGVTAWRKASSADRERFIKEFKVLVVHTYTNALLDYSSAKIDFLPLREDWHKKERVQVQSVITSRKNPVHVDYKLIKSPEDWKVYDIVIEGVSLIKGYNAQFNEQIKHKGLGSVASSIAEMNNKSHHE